MLCAGFVFTEIHNTIYEYFIHTATCLPQNTHEAERQYDNGIFKRNNSFTGAGTCEVQALQ